ncbi:unnamed protein product [Periconia digitata]|uniref:Uncharacterized protein n=1 Tax=Periconia digitata TaxID=1303443 RepID=A0A9W4UJI4_9PLEO|nr:unnamed protein product [Periconia digitata]
MIHCRRRRSCMLAFGFEHHNDALPAAHWPQAGQGRSNLRNQWRIVVWRSVVGNKIITSSPSSISQTVQAAYQPEHAPRAMPYHVQLCSRAPPTSHSSCHPCSQTMTCALSFDIPRASSGRASTTCMHHE